MGRALLSDILPKGLPFSLINCVLNKKTITNIIEKCHCLLGSEKTVEFADNLIKKYCCASCCSTEPKNFPKNNLLRLSDITDTQEKHYQGITHH